MHGIELVVALLLASTVLAGIARAINVHYAIVLVLGGLVVGLPRVICKRCAIDRINEGNSRRVEPLGRRRRCDPRWSRSKRDRQDDG